jgi:hypothetical protein
MASNLKLATATRNAMLDAITSAVGVSGLLDIYSGTQPASPTTAITTQTLLALLTCSSTFAAAASSGVLTANTITADSSANASGTATWYRLKTSGGTGVVDGTVGTTSSDLVLNTASIVSGGPVSVTSFTYTAPGG